MPGADGPAFAVAHGVKDTTGGEHDRRPRTRRFPCTPWESFWRRCLRAATGARRAVGDRFRSGQPGRHPVGGGDVAGSEGEPAEKPELVLRCAGGEKEVYLYFEYGFPSKDGDRSSSSRATPRSRRSTGARPARTARSFFVTGFWTKGTDGFVKSLLESKSRTVAITVKPKKKDPLPEVRFELAGLDAALGEWLRECPLERSNGWPCHPGRYTRFLEVRRGVPRGRDPRSGALPLDGRRGGPRGRRPGAVPGAGSRGIAGRPGAAPLIGDGIGTVRAVEGWNTVSAPCARRLRLRCGGVRSALLARRARAGDDRALALRVGEPRFQRTTADRHARACRRHEARLAAARTIADSLLGS